MNKKYKTSNKLENLTDKKILENWKRYYYLYHEYHITRLRKYHLERMFGWYDWFKEIGVASCEICGYDKHPKALDFHHINPRDKVFGIGKFINGRQCNKENKLLVLEEITKCRILCANCHRIEHFLQTNENSNEHTNK